jgi:hypothetical protein
VLRSDFTDRDRVRVRAGFHAPGNLLRIGLTAEDLQQENEELFDAEASSPSASGDVRFGHVAPR